MARTHKVELESDADKSLAVKRRDSRQTNLHFRKQNESGDLGVDITMRLSVPTGILKNAVAFKKLNELQGGFSLYLNNKISLSLKQEAAESGDPADSVYVMDLKHGSFNEPYKLNSVEFAALKNYVTNEIA